MYRLLQNTQYIIDGGWEYTIISIYYDYNKHKHCAVILAPNYKLYIREIFLTIIDNYYYETVIAPMNKNGEHITILNLKEKRK